MAEQLVLDIPDAPKLAHNITHFARALRKAGLPIGTGRVVDAIRAVQAAGFTNRQDFYWTLHACFVNRPEHRTVFAQVFRLYWRDPRYLEHMMSMMLPAIRGVQEERKADAAEKRAAEALLDGVERDQPKTAEAEDESELEIDASQTASSEERLRSLDFEQMSTAEIAQAKRILARMTLPVKPIDSRRGQASHLGHRIDRARTLRAAMRQGGEIHDILRQKPKQRWPNLVVLCDISGSMSQYSRIVLHFLHAVSNAKGAGWAKVHAFTFGTRLTNITRHLHQRDVDAALAAAGSEAQDWEGGTRIGECLHAFNPRLVTAGHGAGGSGVADLGWSGSRRPRGVGQRDGAVAPVGPSADLAEPLVAVGWLCAQGTGCSGDAASCGQFPCQSLDRLARGFGDRHLKTR